MAEQMLEKLPCKVKSARSDGAYDASRFRKKVHEKGGICIVPPPRDAAYKGKEEVGGKRTGMMRLSHFMDLDWMF